MRSDIFGYVGMLVAFVLNTGEASDEMCSPKSSGPPEFTKCALLRLYGTAGFAYNKVGETFGWENRLYGFLLAGTLKPTLDTTIMKFV